jgi:hypothetical protein
MMESVNIVVDDGLSDVSSNEKMDVEEIVELEEAEVNANEESEESTTPKPRMLSKDSRLG